MALFSSSNVITGAVAAQTAIGAIRGAFDSKLFAVLGFLDFEVLTAPESFLASRTYTFASHDVVEGFPKLQWTGDELETIELRINVHVSYGDPAALVGTLRAMANSHAPQALTFGNGVYRGEYVIERISEDLNYTTGDGTIIASSVTVSLLEWPPESAEELSKRRARITTTGSAATRVLGLSARDAALAARAIVLNAVQNALSTSNTGQSLFAAIPLAIAATGAIETISNVASPSYISPLTASRWFS